MIKYITLLFFTLVFVCFGVAFYFSSIEDELFYKRFMGIGTAILFFLAIPSFLIWGHLKRQKRSVKTSNEAPETPKE